MEDSRTRDLTLGVKFGLSDVEIEKTQLLHLDFEKQKTAPFVCSIVVENV